MSELNNDLVTEVFGSPMPTKPDQPAFDLAISIFDLTFPVPWANAEGSINVTHSLRRPSPDQEAEYRQKLIYKQRQSAKKTTDEGSTTSEAMNWLWDQCALSVDGYPGMPLTDVTPELAAKMRSTHKDLAITAMTACDAEILYDESETTFDGGEWVVRLRLGLASAPFGVFKIRLREWTEKERKAFDKSSGSLSSETQGKTQLKTSAINQKVFVSLFDALFIRPEKDNGKVLVNGKTFGEAGKEEFQKHFLGEWKVNVIFELTQLWQRQLSD